MTKFQVHRPSISSMRASKLQQKLLPTRFRRKIPKVHKTLFLSLTIIERAAKNHNHRVLSVFFVFVLRSGTQKACLPLFQQHTQKKTDQKAPYHSVLEGTAERIFGHTKTDCVFHSYVTPRQSPSTPFKLENVIFTFTFIFMQFLHFLWLDAFFSTPI